jgi:tellurite resistance protein TerC
MGLRALYFLLGGVMGLFRYLHYGLSAILVFIGVKMLLHDVFHIHPMASLLVIVALLGVSIAASLYAARRELAEVVEHADEPVHLPESPPEGAPVQSPE